MCWKDEWVAAIKNLDRGIRHIEKAREKVHQRGLRNEKTIQTCIEVDDAWNRRAAQMRLEKNRAAESQCRTIIAGLKETRGQLQRMVETYGISRKQ